MAITSTYTFDDTNNFTKSNTSVSGGNAELEIVDNPGQNFSQDFSSSSGFTFDNSKAEFSGGQVQQKDQTAASSILATQFSTKDLNWHKGGGSLTGTLNGAPTFGTGKMVCTGTQGVYFTRNTSTIETHKFKYTPNYSTSPPANVNLLTLWNGTNNNDRIFVTNSPSGNNIRLNASNSSGTDLFGLAVVGGWTPVAGQEYEFEVVIDSVAGTIRVFIDGNLLGTQSPGSWSRNAAASRAYIGASPTVYNRAEGSFDDYISFNNAQHTSSYTPGYTIAPFIYTTTNVGLPNFSYTGLGTVQAVESSAIVEAGSPRYTVGGQYWNGSSWAVSNGTYAQANDSATVVANLDQINVTGATSIPVTIYFTESNTQSSVDDIDVTVTGQKYADEGYIEPAQAIQAASLSAYTESVTNTANTDLKIIIKVDGTLKYWNGSAWVDSDGTSSQASDAADVNSNLSSLDLGQNSSVFVRWILTTTSNTETPQLSESSITYDFGGVETDTQECIIYGYIKDIAGQPVEGAVITFSLEKSSRSAYSEANANVILDPDVSATTDATGYFEQPLVRSSEYESGTATYKVILTIGQNSISKNNNANLTFTVPDAVSKDITDLFTQS